MPYTRTAKRANQFEEVREAVAEYTVSHLDSLAARDLVSDWLQSELAARRREQQLAACVALHYTQVVHRFPPTLRILT